MIRTEIHQVTVMLWVFPGNTNKLSTCTGIAHYNNGVFDAGRSLSGNMYTHSRKLFALQRLLRAAGNIVVAHASSSRMTVWRTCAIEKRCINYTQVLYKVKYETFLVMICIIYMVLLLIANEICCATGFNFLKVKNCLTCFTVYFYFDVGFSY